MRAESLDKQASQSVLGRQVQAPALLHTLTPRRNAPYSFHQLPCAYSLKGRAPEESTLYPLKQVVGNEYQPQKGINSMEGATTQVAQPLHHAPRLEEGFDGLSSSIQMPQRQRKTMVLCEECHSELHAGKLQGSKRKKEVSQGKKDGKAEILRNE